MKHSQDCFTTSKNNLPAAAAVAARAEGLGY